MFKVMYRYFRLRDPLSKDAFVLCLVSLMPFKLSQQEQFMRLYMLTLLNEKIFGWNQILFKQ